MAQDSLHIQMCAQQHSLRVRCGTFPSKKVAGEGPQAMTQRHFAPSRAVPRTSSTFLSRIDTASLQRSYLNKTRSSPKLDLASVLLKRTYIFITEHTNDQKWLASVR